MNRQIFGTDGIRGRANSEPMTAETALSVGMAAGRIFTRGPHRHTVVIGKDTRLSCYMVEAAMMAGFVAVGMDVVLSGPMPTPAIAMLTRSLRADLGVMISASHNSYEDNGIKLFGPDGYKLSDETEVEIEALAASDLTAGLAESDALGRGKRLADAEGRYIEFVKNTFPKGLRLDGLKVVVDCAHGAAYRVAPTMLWELGAEVIAIGNDPDGFNINKGCGSTDTAAMRQAIVDNGADLGIALDGDADRVLIADENGSLLDGDQLMAVIAQTLQRDGLLRGGGVVATVMSNLGLELYLKDLGLELVRTQVGDRYVVEHMRRQGYNVGGEQSGHIILGDYATTGDGLIAALQILAVLVREGQRLSDIGKRFTPMPQLLKNVRYAGKPPLDTVPVKKAVSDAETKLGKTGRLLVRKSGTEPIVRVMAEGEDEALIKDVVSSIVDAMERSTG